MEKKYLENIIAPFKDKVAFIKKQKGAQKGNQRYEGIRIVIIGEYYSYLYETIELPYFKRGAMYKGMKNNIEYKISELGLFEQ